MVNIIYAVFYFLSQFTFFPSSPLFHNDALPTQSPKSIAIIGAGSSGLAMLKTLVDLPEQTKKSLNFVLFEQRRDLGGIWYVQIRVLHGKFFEYMVGSQM